MTRLYHHRARTRATNAAADELVEDAGLDPADFAKEDDGICRDSKERWS